MFFIERENVHRLPLLVATWSIWIQARPTHFIYFISILLLSSHLCIAVPSGRFCTGFWTRNFNVSHLSFPCYMSHPSHPPWLDNPSNI